MNEELFTVELLDLSQTIAEDMLSRVRYPWEILGSIGDFIVKTGSLLPKDKYTYKGNNVWISNTAEIYPSSYISGPAIIQEDTQIRHCAFIRGNAVIGRNCVVGNSSEIKNSILFNGVQVPHYNYIGDSVLGYKVHLGAGAITSNVKSDKSPVTISINKGKTETGLKKFGAVIGDFTEIGCNCVLNPGTIIGRNSSIYPLSMVRGYIEQNSILKDNGIIVKKIPY